MVIGKVETLYPTGPPSLRSSWDPGHGAVATWGAITTAAQMRDDSDETEEVATYVASDPTKTGGCHQECYWPMTEAVYPGEIVKVRFVMRTKYSGTATDIIPLTYVRGAGSIYQANTTSWATLTWTALVDPVDGLPWTISKLNAHDWGWMARQNYAAGVTTTTHVAEFCIEVYGLIPIRETSSVNTVMDEVIARLNTINAAHDPWYLVTPLTVQRQGDARSDLAAPRPALLVSIAKLSENLPGLGGQCECKLTFQIACLGRGGVEADRDIWDLEADVRRALQADMTLTGLVKGGLFWQGSEVEALIGQGASNEAIAVATYTGTVFWTTDSP